MPTAAFVSPHLDDVAFSVGGTLVALGTLGWRTVVVTAFTASVPAPTGFALDCQLDKGLRPDVDYLAVRRREDEEFARRSCASELRWLGLAEAPHRGYGSASALFGPYVDGDDVASRLRERLAATLAEVQPDIVLAPQALGGHVDHRRVAEAVGDLCADGEVWWYRDVPYAIREARARSPLSDVDALPEQPIDVTRALDTKCWAATAYATQLPFQFGGPEHCRRALRDHARAEAARVGGTGAAEVVRTPNCPSL